MAKHILDINEDQIRGMFEVCTGIPAAMVQEITHAFPISLTAHLYTQTKTFNFRLTESGRAVKGSFEEEK